MELGLQIFRPSPSQLSTRCSIRLELSRKSLKDVINDMLESEDSEDESSAEDEVMNNDESND